MLLDFAISIYQWICFPLYRIEIVQRRDYWVFDRTHLAYLNLIEKMNCAYCSCANGLAAYFTEIASTETGSEPEVRSRSRRSAAECEQRRPPQSATV